MPLLDKRFSFFRNNFTWNYLDIFDKFAQIGLLQPISYKGGCDGRILLLLYVANNNS